MTRVFGRGELKRALLQVTAEVGPANGYAIMSALDTRVGGGWRPSPGAVYPALLALEDLGLVRGSDAEGGRTYVVTAAGRRELAAQPDAIAGPAARARRVPDTTTVGAVLDQMARDDPRRHHRLSRESAAQLGSRVRALLDDALPRFLADPDPGDLVGPTKENHDG